MLQFQQSASLGAELQLHTNQKNMQLVDKNAVQYAFA